MELVVFIVVLVAFAALSECFGVDRRNNVRSHATELVALGFTRDQRAPMPPEQGMC